jgi:hypothetical protein
MQPVDGDTKKQRKKNMKKNKHDFYSDLVNKLMSKSSPMLCGSHFCLFSPQTYTIEGLYLRYAAARRQRKRSCT